MKMKICRRFISAAMAVTLVLALGTAAVFAEGDDDEAEKIGTALTADGGELSSGSYYLEGNLTLTTDLTIQENEEVNINLGGYTLTGSGNGSVITNSGDLTITNGTITGTSKNATHGAIYSEEGSSLTLNGVTVSNNATNSGNGGGLYFAGDSLIISDCVFEKNSANASSHYGGGIYIASGSADISKTKFDSNTVSNNNGGGIYFSGDSLTISDCSFSSNKAGSGGNGGGIYVASGIVTITGCEFTGNTSTAGSGAGIYFSGTSLDISDCTFSGNSAGTGSGGGIYASKGTVTVTNTIFSENYNGSTVHNGGGIYFSGTTLSVSNCEFIKNTACGHGSGIYAAGNSEVTVSKTTFSENTTSPGYGGGIYFSGSSLDISNCTISDNSAWVCGGLYINSGSVTVKDTTITGNKSTSTSSSGGGGVYNNGTLVMTGGAIYGNTDPYRGADVYNKSGKSITLPDAASMQADGYPVTGWYYDANGSRYADTDNPEEYTPQESDVNELSLIASYEITVSYDLNGGSGTVPEETTEKDAFPTVAADSGDGLTVPDGYCQFVGWNTAADGSGDSYEAGTQYTFTTDTILYAQWSEHTSTDEGVKKAPTCTRKGYTTYTCSECGEEYISDYTNATGHSWDRGRVTVEPTSTEPGLMTYTCTVCGATRTVEIAATGELETEEQEEELPSEPEEEEQEEDIPSESEEEPAEEEPQTVEPFTDAVDESKYYYDALLWAKETGIAQGYPDGTFGVEDLQDREDMVTFLYRLAGSPEVGNVDLPFTDVTETDYYYDAVCWAYQEGIVLGMTDTTFGCVPCTREQFVTLLYRMAGSPEVSGTVSFTDVTDPDAYYYDAVLWGSVNGYVLGYGNDIFGVGDDILRVDAITILYRMAVK